MKSLININQNSFSSQEYMLQYYQYFMLNDNMYNGVFEVFMTTESLIIFLGVQYDIMYLKKAVKIII